MHCNVCKKSFNIGETFYHYPNYSPKGIFCLECFEEDRIRAMSKYKVGDKVIVQRLDNTCSEAIEAINNLADGEATIRDITIFKNKKKYYKLEETNRWLFCEDNILCLAKDYFVPIKSRFEILDI